MRWIIPLGSRLMVANHHQQQQQQQTPRRSVEELSQRRKDFIQETLVLRKVITGTGDTNDDASAPPSLKRLKSDLILPVSTTTHHPESSDTDDNESLSSDESPTCTICFNPYKEKDEICWSNNPNCSHMFHKDCIGEWLMRADECPCCRLDYMQPRVADDEEEGSGNICEASGTSEVVTTTNQEDGEAPTASQPPRRRRRPMERVPPLSNEETSALEQGNHDLVFRTNDEESFLDVLSTIEQMYRRAQAQLYYDNSDREQQQDDAIADPAAATIGPRIISIPMPSLQYQFQLQQRQQQQQQQQENRQEQTEHEEEAQEADIELGLQVGAQEQEGEENLTASEIDALAAIQTDDER
jgi:NACalpha-BTF3-like transcription factor